MVEEGSVIFGPLVLHHCMLALPILSNCNSYWYLLKVGGHCYFQTYLLHHSLRHWLAFKKNQRFINYYCWIFVYGSVCLQGYTEIGEEILYSIKDYQ